MKSRYDVIVVGGGNAGLCAAISASENSSNILLVESAPKYDRGGNSKYTRDIRYAHEPDKYTSGEYSNDEFTQDVMRVTHNNSDAHLLDIVVSESRKIPEWLEANNVKIHAALKGTLHLGRTNLFMLGGGKAMMNSYYDSAAGKGVDVVYETQCTGLNFSGNRISSVTLTGKNGTFAVEADAVVVAAGGLEANLEWLGEYWGDAVNNFIVRGSRHNRGVVLRQLMGHGAKMIGDLGQFHSVAVDARSPRYDGGIVTRVDSVPFGITVNRNCERFYDEGEDLWPRRYAIWGRMIAEQPGQMAFSVVDSKARDMFLPTVFEPHRADTIEELALKMGLDPKLLSETVDRFNKSANPECRFNREILDDCATTGLAIPKSHWARAIDKPPFYGYSFKPGITFTYFGVQVNDKSQVLNQDDTPFENLFSAGEIMSGNILSEGYLAGFGLTIGTVMGIIAGREASKVA